MRQVGMLTLVAVLGAPAVALGAGGHDAIGCVGCHSGRSENGSVVSAAAPNTKLLDPATGQPYRGAAALCLACHAEPDQGGQGYAPVSQHTSHPFAVASVNPKVAKVPAVLLRDGGFDCLGCHDPHPSNPNYKYLRVDTAQDGDKLDAFCGMCHPAKADPEVERPAMFDSMDEGRPLPPAKPRAGGAKPKR